MDSRTRYSKPVALVLLLAAWTALRHVSSASAATATIPAFFIHNNVGTFPSSADVLLYSNPLTAPLNSDYGTYVVFDDSVTAQSDANSLEVGRARGSYLYVAKDTAGAGVQFVVTVVFNAASGAPGSTLSFVGFFRTTDTTGYISIVGGTGVFVKAAGQAAISIIQIVNSASVVEIIPTFTYGL